MKNTQAENNIALTENRSLTEENLGGLPADQSGTFAPPQERHADVSASGTEYGADEEIDFNAGLVAEEEAAITLLRGLFGDEELVDTEEAAEDEDIWAEHEEDEPILVYDVPRPALTINEAASILGRSVRAVERSITGKWGNRLPEGWKARKMKIDGQDEWRIIPPPSFRIRHSNKVRTPGTQIMTNSNVLKEGNGWQAEKTDHSGNLAREEESSLESKVKDVAESLLGFSLNNLIQSAGKKAKTELVKAAEYALDNNMMEHPTIVIDRSDEVERLLRQLSDAQKELAEERRLHMEDLRMLADMQSSFRLLEMKSSQTSVLKEELAMATQALKEHKKQYQEFLSLPWWKRIFRKAP